METLRTSDERFIDLPDYPFKAHYINVEDIRIHYLDEGKNDETWLFIPKGHYEVKFQPKPKNGLKTR